jgi:NAD(P)-dependent dehydrogenase (short-subunit alcohol dehydrogenase family)
MAVELPETAAVVTGAGSGLGMATARTLVARGASVALVDVNSEAVATLAEELGEKALAAPADVTDEDSLAAALSSARERLGPLRLLVCCHGILRGAKVLGKRGPAPLADFEATIAVNLIGSFNALRLAAAEMGENEPDADGERGAVVLTASIAAYEGQVGQTAYAASKAGIVGLVLPAARDLAGVGIRVVAVAPGTFDTPMLAGLPEEVREALGKQIPFPPRLGRPEEFADLVCHAAGNPVLNGTTVRLDGALRLPPQ